MAKIKHKAIYTTHYYNHHTDHKVYDYNDGFDITDKQLYDGYIVNVPCYKVEDLTLAMYGKKRNYLITNPTTKHQISIQTDNHKGKQYRYVLATAEMDELVKQQATFGCIKGHISKMPKKHLKAVHVINRGKDCYGCIKVDLYIQDKVYSEHLTAKVLDAIK